MLVLLDLSEFPYFQGRADAAAGEPLFPDEDPEYIRGWCAYHGIENPYKPQPQEGAPTDE